MPIISVVFCPPTVCRPICRCSSVKGDYSDCREYGLCLCCALFHLQWLCRDKNHPVYSESRFYSIIFVVLTSLLQNITRHDINVKPKNKESFIFYMSARTRSCTFTAFSKSARFEILGPILGFLLKKSYSPRAECHFAGIENSVHPTYTLIVSRLFGGNLRFIATDLVLTSERLHVEMVRAIGFHEQTGLDLAERILSGELGKENRFELTDGGKMFAVTVTGMLFHAFFSKRYRETNLKSC